MHAATQQVTGSIATIDRIEHGAPVIALSVHFDRGAIAPVPMPATTPRQFTIQGVTRDGKAFRPSDWAERLAGALSSFRPAASGIGSHIGYSPYCVPRSIGNVKCVIVNEALRELEPMAWDFAMNFARDNELQVSEGESGC